MPDVIPLLPHVALQFGGTRAPAELMQDVGVVEVDLGLSLPDMFTIEIHDQQGRWVAHPLLHVGQEVIVGTLASADDGQPPSPLLSGEITSIEATFPESGVPTLVLRGYDRAHQLHRGTRIRSFLQSTDSDIATRIAQERGLDSEVDSTNHVHEQIYQHNQTDYEFLRGRANAIGFVFRVEGRKLLFKKPDNVAGPAVELEYRRELLDFRPRLTVASQVKEVTVRGWDPATKMPLIGRAQQTGFQPTRTGWAKRGSAVAKQAFGDDVAGEMHVRDTPIASQAEGDAAAQSLLAELWSTDMQAEGQAVGNPKLKAGTVAKVEGIGGRFDGEYLITRARHVFESGGHYSTHFTVGGLAPDSTAEILLDGADRIEAGVRSLARGLAIGVVTNNVDPENRGRVKVKLPWLSDEAESTWARLAMPMAGNDRGFYFLPEVNDEVVVGFEHGDFNYPIVLGSLWNGVDVPPKEGSDAVGGGDVNKRILKSRSGHIVLLDDTGGNEQIKIVDKTGNNSIVIDSASDTLTVKLNGDIELKAVKGVTVSARTISLEGQQTVELSGAEVSVSATGRLKLSGAMVEIN